MAKSVSKNDIQNMSEDWGHDLSNGLPYSGAAVQKFIKNTFKSKMGYFYYDTSSNRYLVFADEESKNKFVENPTLTEFVLGSFDAPFNYEASITMLTSAYNAVFLGSTGNYIDFTFDIKNKEGSSTGENVTVTYTFIRNATKKVLTETRRYGESVHFNIDDYLLEGTNTIIVGISGQTTLAATTAALTYQVVNLSYSDEMNISKVYNLLKGVKMIEVFFNVSGYGTKIIEWFLDGKQLDFVKSEDEVSDVMAQRTKNIELSNLASGIHTLQSRAYTIINGEKFYTDTLYREIMVDNGDIAYNMVALAANIPNSHGVVTENNPFLFYGAEQYIPYELRFATKKKGNVSIYLGSELVGTLTSSANTESRYSITSNKAGTISVKFIVDGVERVIPISVNQTSLNIEEIKTSLSFDFRATGKSNTSVDKDVWSYGDYTATFEGFNWNASSGWVDNSLLINNGASFSVNIAPLAKDITSTGKTLEFEFSTRNVENDDAVICDLTTNGKGLLITASEARLTSSAGEVVNTRFKAGEVNRIAFVVNRNLGVQFKGLVFIYVNGILSGAVNYGSADNFISSKYLTFVGTEDAQVELRAMRFYDTALSSENIINNYIIYRNTLNEMLEVYYRNDIYEEGTQNLSPDLMLHRLPVMVITGDVPTLEAATSTSTQILVDIDYTNEQDPTKNFKMKNAALRIQGTSSLAYPRKNFRFYTQKEASTIVYDSEGKKIGNKLYSFKDGAQPVDCWCLKADFAESSGTHNTAIARLWNKAMYGAIIQHKNVLGEEVNGYALRTNAQIAALNAGYEYDVRTTIDGFPIVLFYKKNESDTDLIFLGKYNFNNDKSTPSVFGFENIPNFDNSRMQCWETKDNGHPLGLFTDVSRFDADWSEAFESRYPDTKIPNTADLKAFSIWMNGVSQSDFITQKWAHFDVYKVAAYYCYLMRFGAVDQPVKNAFLTSEDGEKFYFINYDNDTINGLINTGRLALDPTINRDTIGSDGEYVYAGHNSVLWNRLTNDAEFMEIVSIVDNALYSAGLRYDEVIAEFNEKQASKWVERVYNQDAEYKYVLPYVSQATNNLFMLQGSRSSHRSWWLSKRFSLYDSLFLSGAYRDRNISFKCLNDTQPNQKFSITAATKMNYGYGVNNGIRETGIELSVGENYTFSTTDTLNLGDVVKVFAAANLLKLDLSQMADRIAILDCTAAADFYLGSRLRSIILGGNGKINTELPTISGINVLTSLQELNVEGYKNMTYLDLSEQRNLRKVYAMGSSIASIDFAEGAPVDRLELPPTMMALNFNQLPYLTFDNISFEGGLSNIHTIKIYDCPNLTNDFEFVLGWYNSKNTPDAKCTIDINGVNWSGVRPEEMVIIGNIKKEGGVLSLKGRVDLNTITYDYIEELKDIYGEQVFSASSDLFFSAPDGVYIYAPKKMVDGDTLQMQAYVFSNYSGHIEWSVLSGDNVTIDNNGLITTTETGIERTITIQAMYVLSNGAILFNSCNIDIVERIRPTGGVIEGTDIVGGEEIFTLKTEPNGVNSPYTVNWSISGDAVNAGYVHIKSQSVTSCVLGLQNAKTSSFTLTATIIDDKGASYYVKKELSIGTSLTVVMSSSTGDNSILSDIEATVTFGDKTLACKNGERISIPMGVVVKIVFQTINGYVKPKDFEYTSSQNPYTISVVYKKIIEPSIVGVTDLSKQNALGQTVNTSTANCYVVRIAGTYAFPLVYGNAFKDGNINKDAYTKNNGSYSTDFVNHLDDVISSPFIEDHEGCYATLAELTMADTDDIFTDIEIIYGGASKYIKFNITSIPPTGANGVISVLDASGVVMWSWHIWVWADDLTPVTITNSTGVQYNILPVNLATKKSTTAGKMYNWFYQWGRPTPMLPPDDYNSEDDATNYGVKTFANSSIPASTYGESIRNPNIMYYGSSSGGSNWFGTSVYFNLWDANCVSTGASDNNVVKTVYDPCPVGFKMPNGNTFTSFLKTNVVGNFNNGWCFKRNNSDTTGVFFPASGRRDPDSWGVTDVGKRGYVNTASMYRLEYVHYFSFDNTNIDPQSDYGDRWEGYSVRPVQE